MGASADETEQGVAGLGKNDYPKMSYVFRAASFSRSLKGLFVVQRFLVSEFSVGLRDGAKSTTRLDSRQGARTVLLLSGIVIGVRVHLWKLKCSEVLDFVPVFV